MTHEDRIAEAVAALRDAHDLLAHDIADYPTPISPCDAQFNALLSDRARIANALQALDDRPFIPTSRNMEAGSRVESQ